MHSSDPHQRRLESPSAVKFIQRRVRKEGEMDKAGGIFDDNADEECGERFMERTICPVMERPLVEQIVAPSLDATSQETCQ